MEFSSENAIMCIINLLFIPFIALRYYCRRRKIPFEFSPDTVYAYVLICVLNVLAAAFFVSLLERFMSASYQITTGGQLGAELPIITLFNRMTQQTFSCSVYSRTYTVVALLSSYLLVLFMELIRKTFSIDVSIEKKQKRKKAIVPEENSENENKN